MARDKTGRQRTRTKKQLKEFKNTFYLTILLEVKDGLNPQQIAKKHNYSIQRINYYITKLKKWGYLLKVGYGTWSLSRLGRYVTTKKFIWGSHEKPKQIELWRLGWRFFVKHDNPIPELKEQILKQGGKVHQGRVMNCWVMKGKETLDIYGTVAKSNNLWDAAMIAINEVVACRGFIEEKYKIGLEPMEVLRPDIIVNTPETKAIAEKIFKDFGRFRSEVIEVDESKTGSPEFEARTFDAANNVLDNLGLSNRSEILEEKIDKVEKLLMGSLPVQTAIANSQNLQAATMKELSTAITQISTVLDHLSKGKLEGPSGPIEPVKMIEKKAKRKTGDLSDYTEDKFEPTEIVELDLVHDTPKFMGIYKNEERTYSPMKQGARIFVEWLTASALIKQGYAKLVRRG